MKPPLDKNFVLSSIASIASATGRAPSRPEFISTSGISEHQINQFFPTWNDAVRAAGLIPHTINKRLKDSDLLDDWAFVVRTKGKIPARRAYRHLGQYDPRTFRRFGPWSKIPDAFRAFAQGNPDYADVLALLPSPKPAPSARPSASPPPSSTQPAKVRHPSLEDRPTYGQPMDFRGLRYEPVNELGVVLLFGMVAHELGYRVETVQSGFPDCEAQRRVASQRWQRVHLEFEFESRNFRDHGHPAAGCDVIVCWRHNWPDHPPHLEILELSSLLPSLTSEARHSL